MMRTKRKLTEDSQRHAASSHLPADLMGDGALVGAAVLRGGFDDKEGVDDVVMKGLSRVNGFRSLREEKKSRYRLQTAMKQTVLTRYTPRLPVFFLPQARYVTVAACC